MFKCQKSSRTRHSMESICRFSALIRKPKNENNFLGAKKYTPRTITGTASSETQWKKKYRVRYATVDENRVASWPHEMEMCISISRGQLATRLMSTSDVHTCPSTYTLQLSHMIDLLGKCSRALSEVKTDTCASAWLCREYEKKNGNWRWHWLGIATRGVIQ